MAEWLGRNGQRISHEPLARCGFTKFRQRLDAQLAFDPLSNRVPPPEFAKVASAAH